MQLLSYFVFFFAVIEAPIPEKCESSEWGCCLDGINFAIGPNREGCPEACRCHHLGERHAAAINWVGDMSLLPLGWGTCRCHHLGGGHVAAITCVRDMSLPSLGWGHVAAITWVGNPSALPSLLYGTCRCHHLGGGHVAAITFVGSCRCHHLGGGHVAAIIWVATLIACCPDVTLMAC